MRWSRALSSMIFGSGSVGRLLATVTPWKPSASTVSGLLLLVLAAYEEMAGGVGAGVATIVGCLAGGGSVGTVAARAVGRFSLVATRATGTASIVGVRATGLTSLTGDLGLGGGTVVLD